MNVNNIIDDERESGSPVVPEAKHESVAEGLGVFASEADDMKELRALLDFSINNNDLDKLESLISAFNPFKILGIQDNEIRHSNVLSWLIDPNGHHGLGDTLFKNLLLEVLKDNRGGNLPQIKDVIVANFSDLRVFREWRNIDLIAVSQSNKTVLVIENKIEASEEKTQLARYAAIVKDKYPDFNQVFLFLTLDGAEPKGSALYIPFTHEQVHWIVKSTVEIRQDYMHSKVYDFIQYYLSSLEEKIMKSSELIDICTKLYREYGSAINTIIQYGKPKFQISSIHEFHTKTKTTSVHADKNSVSVYYPFIPNTWKDKVPETNKNTSDRYLVYFYLNFSDYESHKIIFSIIVGEFPDPDERIRFLENLSKAAEANSDGKLKIKTTSTKSTSLFSKTITLKDEANGEYGLDDYQLVCGMLIKTYQEFVESNVFKVIDEVVKSFRFKDAVITSAVNA